MAKRTYKRRSTKGKVHTVRFNEQKRRAVVRQSKKSPNWKARHPKLKANASRGAKMLGTSAYTIVAGTFAAQPGAGVRAKQKAYQDLADYIGHSKGHGAYIDYVNYASAPRQHIGWTVAKKTALTGAPVVGYVAYKKIKGRRKRNGS